VSRADPGEPVDGFCRFCGATDLVMTQYEGKAAESSISVNVTTGPVGGGGGKGPRSHQKVSFPTDYCRTCREINASCASPPLRATVSIPGSVLELHLPHQLVIFLKAIQATEDEMLRLCDYAVPRALLCMKKYAAAGGNNPCEKRHVGFPVKLCFRGTTFRVFMILGPADEPGNAFVVRLAYGGGNANCQ